MAAEARREARRKRILQNSDSRLKRILDSKTSEAAIHDESTALLSGSSNLGKLFIAPSETPEDDKSSLQEIQTESKENADKTKPNDKISTPARDLCQETVQSLRERTKDPQKDEEIKGNIDGSTSRKTTVKQERFNLGSLGTWLRIVLNVSLALCLVTLSTKYKIQQNFLVPWIALQVVMFFFPQFRQDISSSWLSVLQVSLQLCGVPSHTTRGLDNAYAFVILLLSDLPIFIFSVVFWFTIAQQILELEVSS